MLKKEILSLGLDLFMLIGIVAFVVRGAVLRECLRIITGLFESYADMLDRLKN